MKNKLIILCLSLLLVGCNNVQKPSEELSSEVEQSSEQSSEVLSENSSENKEEDEENKLDYSLHPLSEPSINRQLVTFNPMGNLMDVWDYYRGDGVLVAVIDSGFDYDHPEFIDINGKSRVSEKSAYIYTTASKQTKIEVGRNKVDITDGDSHGTICAGLLGSSVNKKGITGIAPNVDLMLIKIDKHALSMAEAFKYAADNGAKVISTSLGQYPNPSGESYGDIHFEMGLDLSTVFNENINYAYNKGVTIVAATGNSRETRLSYPAGCQNVIGAGGLNAGSKTQIWDNGYEGSNYNGNQVYVDVFAPSDGIYAPGFDTSTNKPTYWDEAKGTSFAAPLIAGAIALYYQKYPDATNVQVENALKNACTNLSSYNNNKNMGWGRLDVDKFLKISEDIKDVKITPTTSITQSATKLQIIDEEGWNFRTLHLYNLVFESGYGYKEFEDYLDYTYTQKVSTSSYQLEGTKKCYAYTDEGYVGDYYLCLGNTVDGKQTQYDYIFPWWVKEFSYQIVNNNHWFPEDGGNSITYSNGYGKDVKSYFWYDSPTQFDVTQVVGNSFNTSIPAFKVINKNNEENIVSIFDKFN